MSDRQLWMLPGDIREEQIRYLYWPKGFESCAIMTHDVETGAVGFLPSMLELERNTESIHRLSSSRKSDTKFPRNWSQPPQSRK